MGRQVLLLIHHANRKYTSTYAEQECWTDEVLAHWIDHNGGGWTYHGMCGEPQCWREME